MLDLHFSLLGCAVGAGQVSVDLDQLNLENVVAANLAATDLVNTVIHDHSSLNFTWIEGDSNSWCTSAKTVDAPTCLSTH
jgi:hypothetical protein